MSLTTRIFMTLAALPLATGVLMAQLQKEEIAGIRNYTKVDATIGCAGATEVAAIPEVAKRGYKSILNLRLANERNNDLDASKAAAEASGMKYLHLPFNGSEPDPKVADAFIAAVTETANQPVFIHCGSANRVGALWLAKRMLVDKWNEARAVEEATAIGLSSDALQAFALEYVRSRR